METHAIEGLSYGGRGLSPAHEAQLGIVAKALPPSVQTLQVKTPGSVPAARKYGRAKTPADLLALVPSDDPISLRDLFRAARAGHINERYSRKFLAVLKQEGLVQEVKIQRPKSKSAVGYLRLDV